MIYRILAQSFQLISLPDIVLFHFYGLKYFKISFLAHILPYSKLYYKSFSLFCRPKQAKTSFLAYNNRLSMLKYKSASYF